MPGAANNNGFDARRFASLMARFDMGNPSEAEAMNAARAMRRMVENAGVRFVDVMERAEVKEALDDQMQPVREHSPELQKAREEASALRQELTERTRDVRELAELLRRERAQAGKQATKPAPAPASSFGPMNGGVIAAVVVIVLLLLVTSAFHRESFEVKEAHNVGLASDKGEGVAGLPKGLGVLHIPNAHRLPRRVRRGGPSGDAQSIRKFPEPPAQRVEGAVGGREVYERQRKSGFLPLYRQPDTGQGGERRRVAGAEAGTAVAPTGGDRKASRLLPAETGTRRQQRMERRQWRRRHMGRKVEVITYERLA